MRSTCLSYHILLDLITSSDKHYLRKFRENLGTTKIILTIFFVWFEGTVFP